MSLRTSGTSVAGGQSSLAVCAAPRDCRAQCMPRAALLRGRGEDAGPQGLLHAQRWATPTASPTDSLDWRDFVPGVQTVTPVSRPSFCRVCSPGYALYPSCAQVAWGLRRPRKLGSRLSTLSAGSPLARRSTRAAPRPLHARCNRRRQKSSGNPGTKTVLWVLVECHKFKHLRRFAPG